MKTRRERALALLRRPGVAPAMSAMMPAVAERLAAVLCEFARLEVRRALDDLERPSLRAKRKAV